MTFSEVVELCLQPGEKGIQAANFQELGAWTLDYAYTELCVRRGRFRDDVAFVVVPNDLFALMSRKVTGDGAHVAEEVRVAVRYALKYLGN